MRRVFGGQMSANMGRKTIREYFKYELKVIIILIEILWIFYVYCPRVVRVDGFRVFVKVSVSLRLNVFLMSVAEIWQI